MSQVAQEIARLKAENEQLKKAQNFPAITARIMSQPDSETTLTQRIMQQGLLTPEATKPVHNALAVKAEDYEALLSKWPEQYRYKLRAYTGEELYYLYRICTYKAKVKDGTLSNSSDAFVLAQKARCFKWLRGELRSGVNSAVLNSIGRKFRDGFHDLIVDSVTREMIDGFGKTMNSKRVMG
jgi:hypothetical protein